MYLIFSEKKMKTILVTGGGGFVGKSLIKKLLGNGYAVKSLSRSYYQELANIGVTCCQGDIGDNFDKIDSFFKDVYAVFHVASKVDMWGKYPDFYKTNVIGTQNIIKACKGNNVKYLIYTSSPSVIANDMGLKNVDATFPYPKKYDAFYPQTKAMAEKEIINAGKNNELLTMVLRPHLIWGPNDNNLIPTILNKAKNGKLRQIGDGENIVDCSYIEDCTDAHILALKALEKNPFLSSNVYFVTQDEHIKLWDFVNSILMAYDLAPVTKKVSKNLAFTLAKILESISKIIPSFKPLFTKFLITEMTTDHYFNIEKTKQDLGYSPKYTIKEGIKIISGNS